MFGLPLPGPASLLPEGCRWLRRRIGREMLRSYGSDSRALQGDPGKRRAALFQSVPGLVSSWRWALQSRGGSQAIMCFAKWRDGGCAYAFFLSGASRGVGRGGRRNPDPRSRRCPGGLRARTRAPESGPGVPQDPIVTLWLTVLTLVTAKQQ